MPSITRPIARTYSCELLVIGSGVAGMTAALQAARLGLDTILLEKEAVLGGNSGPLLGIHWGGAHIYHDYAAETGIVMELEEEIAWRGAKHRTPDHHYNISRLAEALWQEKLEQAGVRVLKRHLAREAVTAHRRLNAVLADDLALCQTVRFDVSHAVLDASGDGQIAFAAGASFRMGREPRAEHGERNAPEVADDRVAGVSLTALVRRSETPIPFIPPDDVFSVNLNTTPGGWLGEHDNIRMLWPTETGGTVLNPLTDEHEIYERLLKQFYHYWARLKENPANANWELIWVSPIAGKRETRRFLGDHILTQTDVETPVTLPDRLGYGGFTIDQHEQGADGVNRIFMYSAPPLYDTCYRMTYSRDFDNLYLAGRLISSTHLAHGSTRIIKTGGLLAQGTAIAIALAKEHACTAREVHDQHLATLQQEFLRQDGSLIDLPAADPRDLARHATVTASSEWLYDDFDLRDEQELSVPTGNLLHAWPDHVSTVRAHVRNHSDREQPLRLSLMLAHEPPPEILPRPADEEAGFFHHLFKLDSRLSVFEPLTTLDTTVPASFSGWLDLPLPATLPLPSRSRTRRHQALAVLLEGNHLAVASDPSACDVAQIVKRQPSEPTVSEGRCALTLDQPVPLGEASNIINGVSRRWGRAPLNMWVSAASQPLPQWIELRWAAPQTISRLAFTFDGIGRKYADMPFNNGTRAFGPMVKNYRVEIEVGETWQELLTETDNYHRFRVHEFPPQTVTAVRLTVEAAHDPLQGARVAEILAEN